MVWKGKAYWAALGLILSVGVYVSVLRSSTIPTGKKPELSRIPLVVGTWRGEKQLIGEALDEVLRADESLYVRYVNPWGEVIWLFIGYFQNQKYGSQIHSPKNCLPGGGWRILAQRRYKMRGTNESSESAVPVTYLLISNEQEEDVMLYWFETRRGKIANEFYLKFDLLVNSLFYRPTAAAFVRFNMPVRNGDPQKSLLKLERFIRKLLPSIEANLGFTDRPTPPPSATIP